MGEWGTFPLVDSEARGPVPKGTELFFASLVRCAGKVSTPGLHRVHLRMMIAESHINGAPGGT